MNSISRRVGKLEAATLCDGEDLSAFACDDLAIQLLDLRLALRDAPDPDDEHGIEVKEHHERSLAGIRRLAALRTHPDYQAALAVLAAEFPGFVPAVTGQGDPQGRCELCDLGRPGLFERRTAYLARPDIQALIGEGARQSLNLDPWEVNSVGNLITRSLWRQEVRDREARGWR